MIPNNKQEKEISWKMEIFAGSLALMVFFGAVLLARFLQLFVMDLAKDYYNNKLYPSIFLLAAKKIEKKVAGKYLICPSSNNTYVKVYADKVIITKNSVSIITKDYYRYNMKSCWIITKEIPGTYKIVKCKQNNNKCTLVVSNQKVIGKKFNILHIKMDYYKRDPLLDSCFDSQNFFFIWLKMQSLDPESLVSCHIKSNQNVFYYHDGSFIPYWSINTVEAEQDIKI